MTKVPTAPREFAFVFVFMLGVAALIAATAGIVLNTLEILLNESTYHAMGEGLPWFVAGCLTGAIASLAYMEEHGND